MSDRPHQPLVRSKPSMVQRLFGALLIVGGVLFLLTGAFFAMCALVWSGAGVASEGLAGLNWLIAMPALALGLAAVGLGVWLCVRGPMVPGPRPPEDML